MTEDSPGLDHEVTWNMPYSFPPDVNELVCAYMSSGKYASEDELLRAALQAMRLQAELPGRPTATRPLPTSIVPG